MESDWANPNAIHSSSAANHFNARNLSIKQNSPPRSTTNGGSPIVLSTYYILIF